MPWVSYPFLKLSKSDISENVERDLISYAALAVAAGFAMTPLALSRSVSFNSNPSSLKTHRRPSPEVLGVRDVETGKAAESNC